MTTLNLNWRHALVAAVCTLGALPAAANAADVSIGGATLNYQARNGEVNNPRVSAASAGLLSIADEAPLRAGPGCTNATPTQVVCSRSGGIANLLVRLGDRNDSYGVANGTAPAATVQGELGDDTYVATLSDQPHRVTFSGGIGTDTATYASAPSGVQVFKDRAGNDGRRGIDADNIDVDVERLFGSPSNDHLGGVDSNDSTLEYFNGGAGDDIMTGLRGFAVYDMGFAADGADSISDPGLAGHVDYSKRTKPVFVSVDKGTRDDGEAGEGDSIFGARVIDGGSAGDTLLGGTSSSAQHAVIQGLGGQDTLGGTAGTDSLIGGADFDIFAAGAGTDYLYAEDGGQDSVDCGSDTDTAFTDRTEGAVVNCETNSRVGKLALAADGNTLDLSWTHPQEWKRLKSVQLQVRNADQAALGIVTIHPRTGKVEADGAALGLKKAAVKVSKQGKRVSARITLKPVGALAGQKLTADVTAVDTKGARQTEQRAAVIRVAR